MLVTEGVRTINSRSRRKLLCKSTTYTPKNLSDFTCGEYTSSAFHFSLDAFLSPRLDLGVHPIHLKLLRGGYRTHTAFGCPLILAKLFPTFPQQRRMGFHPHQAIC